MNNKHDSVVIREPLAFIAFFLVLGISPLINALKYLGLDLAFLVKTDFIFLVKVALLIVLCSRMSWRIVRSRLIWCGLYIIIIALSYLVHPGVEPYIIDIAYVFFTYTVPIFIVFSYLNSAESILECWRLMSYIVLPCSGIVPFTKAYLVDTDYMNFAYSALTSWAVITYFAVKERLLRDIVLSLVTAVVYAVYASRGATICMAAFLLYSQIFLQRGMRRHRAIAAILLIGVAVIMYFKTIMAWASRYFTEIGLSTYTIEHFLSGKMFESKSRIIIFQSMFEAIAKNPFGYGVGYDRIIGGGPGKYAHNLFLELVIDFGVAGGLFVSTALAWICAKMLFACDDENYRALFSVVGVIGIGILNISNSVYLRYELFVALYVFSMYNRNKRRYGLGVRDRDSG